MNAPPASPALPRAFSRTCLLLLLRESPSHGYDLIQQVAALGVDASDPGRLYRALRKLEDEGLVHSAWAPSNAGPQRRIYQITRAGSEELHRCARALASGHDHLEAFLSRYQEFVALRGEGRSATERLVSH